MAARGNPMTHGMMQTASRLGMRNPPFNSAETPTANCAVRRDPAAHSFARKRCERTTHVPSALLRAGAAFWTLFRGAPLSATRRSRGQRTGAAGAGGNSQARPCRRLRWLPPPTPCRSTTRFWWRPSLRQRPAAQPFRGTSASSAHPTRYRQVRSPPVLRTRWLEYQPRRAKCCSRPASHPGLPLLAAAFSLETLEPEAESSTCPMFGTEIGQR